MIVADSSAWIDFIRQPERRLGPTVRALLQTGELAIVGMVLMEIVRGLRTDPADNVEELIYSIPFFETTKEAWLRAGQIARALEQEGTPIPVADTIIAATVLDGGHELLTRDKHFERIPGLRLYQPEGNV